MKKIITTLLLLTIFIAVQAQKLESKIPNNVDVLVSANAENLFKLIKVSDIDESAIGKEILKDINRRRDEDKVSSVANAGLDVKSNAYYFFSKTDSISYHNFYVELKDRALFESMLSKRNKKIRRMEGYNIIEGRNDIKIWNDNYLLLAHGDVSRGYFSTHKERLDKLKEEGEFDYNFRKRIAKGWTKKYVLDLFNKSVINSIASNTKFQKSKKKNASATLRVRNYGMLMTDLFKSFGGYLYPMYADGGNQNIYGIEEVTANLFFDKSDARILLDMSVSPDMKKSFKKMYNKRMSRNLVNSFDHDKALAFWSVSIDTEETLKQYPELLHKMYGGILPKFQEEMELVGDLFSLIIDEQAVGRLITGDALLVLNDFSKQEVEYTTYEYDKDYKRKEVTKTKEEFVPDFTLMIGSKEEDLLNKFFKLGEKHKALKIENNVVEFKTKKSDIPFDLYSVVKNDVLYLTTSETNALSIARGNTNFNTKKHNKLIRDNSTVLFVDVNAVLNKIPNKWMSKSEKEAMRFSKNNLDNGVFRVSRMKGNTISSELKIATQGTEENTLKLVLEFINAVAK